MFSQGWAQKKLGGRGLIGVLILPAPLQQGCLRECSPLPFHSWKVHRIISSSLRLANISAASWSERGRSRAIQAVPFQLSISPSCPSPGVADQLPLESHRSGKQYVKSIVHPLNKYLDSHFKAISACRHLWILFIVRFLQPAQIKRLWSGYNSLYVLWQQLPPINYP